MFLAALPTSSGFSCQSFDGQVFAAKDVFEISGRPLLVLNKCFFPSLENAPFLYDLLELFAFAYPAVPIIPTPAAFKEFFKLEADAKDPAILFLILDKLLEKLPTDAESYALLTYMQSHHWPFAPLLLERISAPKDPGTLQVWQRLPEWENTPLPDTPEPAMISAEEAESFLKTVLKNKIHVEARPEQITYAREAPFFTQTPAHEDNPKTLLIEAGTGVGKTLGYLAPLLLAVRKGDGLIWISTFTKNLQHQIDDELSLCFPTTEEKDRMVTLKKGRENYLCLLNFEEALTHASSGQAVYLALLARWILHTKTGDLSGGDCPSWLLDFFSSKAVSFLADRRGECLYSLCPHYKKCFIERVYRKAQRTPIVVTNHALSVITLSNALMRPSPFTPRRIVFDEAHHLFDVADGEYTAKFGFHELASLRRFIQGRPDGRRKQRGLKRRFQDFAALSTDVAFAVEDVIHAAGFLPKTESFAPLLSHEAALPFEQFFKGLYTHVMAQTTLADQKEGYSLEAHRLPLNPAVEAAAPLVFDEIAKLLDHAQILFKKSKTFLSDSMDALSDDQRLTLENLLTLLQMRVINPLSVFAVMLKQIKEETPDGYVDWFSIEKVDGHVIDLAYERHFIDPTLPLAQTLTTSLQGMLMTSATLKDRTQKDETQDWTQALNLTGAAHFPELPKLVSLASPFDYARQARVFVVTDIPKTDRSQIAHAVFNLFKAAGGGGLGLFTSIARLKAVYSILKPLMLAEDIPLYSQHVDAFSLPSLIDLFRAEENSCLLGTDAIRDGVDVPGRALRLLVFDRVPWPRPTIAHTARRAVFGKDLYDRRIVRLKMAQAFGRLIRRQTDKGVFVMLDRALPSDIATAFPEGVVVERLGIKDVLAHIEAFLNN